MVCQSAPHHWLHTLSDITVHDDVVLFDDGVPTDLIVVGIFLILHLLRPTMILLTLGDVPTEHLRILYFDLRIIEDIIIVVNVFDNFNWLLLILLLWF